MNSETTNELTKGITPLPWKFEKKGITANEYSIDSKSKYVGHFVYSIGQHANKNAWIKTGNANVAYLQKACNEYPEAIECLQEVKKFINDIGAGSTVMQAKVEHILNRAKQGA